MKQTQAFQVERHKKVFSLAIPRLRRTPASRQDSFLNASYCTSTRKRLVCAVCACRLHVKDRRLWYLLCSQSCRQFVCSQCVHPTGQAVAPMNAACIQCGKQLLEQSLFLLSAGIEDGFAKNKPSLLLDDLSTLGGCPVSNTSVVTETLDRLLALEEENRGLAKTLQTLERPCFEDRGCCDSCKLF